MELSVLPLTPDRFAPFGQVLQQPERESEAGGPGWKWWGKLARLPAELDPYAIGYLDLQPVRPGFDWAERHMLTVEALVPARGDCLVYVGPPEHPEEPMRLPSLEDFRVFRVRQGQGVLLEKGVWHGVPLAVDRPASVFVFLLQNTGLYDIHLVRFPEKPVRIVGQG